MKKEWNLWTNEEIEILKEWYPVEGTRVKNKLNNKTKRAIQLQAHKLKIEMPDRVWTKEEIDILRKYYLIEGSKIINRLKGRTKKATMAQANRLGLKINNTKALWTKEEIQILVKWYPIEGAKVKNRLNNKTKTAIFAKANKLGLKNRKNGNTYKFVKKKKNGKYVVCLNSNGKQLYFGTFDSEEEAAKVAMEKAKEYGKAI